MPLVLLLLCLAAYGPLSPWLGLYWDDWPKALFAETIGPNAFSRIEAHRPLNGLWYVFFLSILGTSPFGWQLLGLLWRWASALSFWWFLKKLWPGKKDELAWAAMLFALYPGFLQTNLGMTYYVHFLAYALFFLSMGTTLRAMQTEEKSRWLHALALLLSLFSMLVTDYYYGLELIRPIAIYLALRSLQDEPRQRVLQTLRVWLPYLLVVMGVFAWRSGVDAAESYELTLLEKLGTEGPQELMGQLSIILGDIAEGGISAWTQTLKALTQFELASRVSAFILLWSVMWAAAIFIFLKLRPAGKFEGEETAREWRWEILTLGAAALVLANIPAWVSGLAISLHFPANRLTLPMAAGAALLITAAIVFLLRRRRTLQIAAVALAAGLAISLHLQTADSLRLDGETQNAFWQQFSWRVPELRPGTSVLSEELPLAYFSDDSLTGALNLIYPREAPKDDLNAALLYLDLRLGSKIPALEPDKDITWRYRLLEFHGSTSQALVIYYNPPACLRVLDPVVDANFPLLPPLTRSALALSRLEQIVPNAGIRANLPEHLFSTGNESSWCYYFEKADLARQFEDWEQVAALGDAAFNLDDSPNHASERVPFIEGYAHLGRWERALELTREAMEINPLMQAMLCDTWERISGTSKNSDEKLGALEAIEEELACEIVGTRP